MGAAMARPRKPAAEKRQSMVMIRFTADEMKQLKRLAHDAGVPYGRYVRETVLGRRPRSRPARTLVFQKLLYELQSIATNFQQLADATGDDGYMLWAKFVGGQVVEQLIGQDDMSDVIEGQLDALNRAGHQVNVIARKANAEQVIKAGERTAAVRAVTTALSPIRDALRAKTNKKKVLEFPAEQ
jgi:hypothetical protein